MILPILIYGDPILRKKCISIFKNYPGLDKLIKNMFETMYKSKGIGLSAPQIGKNINLFIIDTSFLKENKKFQIKKFKKVFINPKILESSDKNYFDYEGCLSIPTIIEYLKRKPSILIEYFDENWKKHVKIFKGIIGRIFQHEYDHLQGRLFIDFFSSIKKKLIKNKLKKIYKGKIKVYYKIKIYSQSNNY
jgi:peptide deformylase